MSINELANKKKIPKPVSEAQINFAAAGQQGQQQQQQL